MASRKFVVGNKQKLSDFSHSLAQRDMRSGKSETSSANNASTKDTSQGVNPPWREMSETHETEYYTYLNDLRTQTGGSSSLTVDSIRDDPAIYKGFLDRCGGSYTDGAYQRYKEMETRSSAAGKLGK